MEQIQEFVPLVCQSAGRQPHAVKTVKGVLPDTASLAALNAASLRCLQAYLQLWYVDTCAYVLMRSTTVTAACSLRKASIHLQRCGCGVGSGMAAMLTRRADHMCHAEQYAGGGNLAVPAADREDHLGYAAARGRPASLHCSGKWSTQAASEALLL